MRISRVVTALLQEVTSRCLCLGEFIFILRRAGGVRDMFVLQTQRVYSHGCQEEVHSMVMAFDSMNVFCKVESRASAFGPACKV